MKLGLVIYGTLDQRTGGYLYDRRLVEELAALGHEVAIYSLPWRSYGRHLGDNLSTKLVRWLDAEAPVILLQDELNHPSLVFSNGRLRQSGALLVAIVHHLRSNEAWGPMAGYLYRSIERHYLRSLDAVICNSWPTQEATLGLATRRLESVVAWPGTDARASVSKQLILVRAHQPGPLRIVYLGAIIRRKGLEILLRALALLAPGSARLSVIGSDRADPTYSEFTRSLSRRLGSPIEVQWHGQASDADAAEILSSSHVLAVPSWHEGFGIAYLEGMGHGLVPLASSAGGAADLIEDGRTGYLIAPGDVEAVASSLEHLHHHRGQLAAMGTAAAERYRAHPSWRQIAEHVSDFLVQLARGRSAGANPSVL